MDSPPLVEAIQVGVIPAVDTTLYDGQENAQEPDASGIRQMQIGRAHV